LNLPESNPLEQAIAQFKQHRDEKEYQIAALIKVDTHLPMLKQLEFGLGSAEEMCADFIRKYNALYLFG
jgi:hypothetical protein